MWIICDRCRKTKFCRKKHVVYFFLLFFIIFICYIYLLFLFSLFIFFKRSFCLYLYITAFFNYFRTLHTPPKLENCQHHFFLRNKKSIFPIFKYDERVFFFCCRNILFVIFILTNIQSWKILNPPPQNIVDAKHSRKWYCYQPVSNNIYY